MKYTLYAVLLLVASVAPVFGESEWVIISREGGCMALEQLAKRENLEKTPTSPEDFAEMMSTRGYKVALGLLEDFPPELSGKAVQVKVRDNMAPIFVLKEICLKVGWNK